jgi:glutathione reductase (NADPH)
MIGSHPVIPTIPGAELAINSDGFFDLEEQPKSVAVIGTGYIGIELAGIFNALGTNTTIFSRTKHILRHFDPIIRDNLLTEMQSVGVDFAFDTKVKALKRVTSDNTIEIEYESNGKPATLRVDCVLWATGRAPNVSNLNLDAAQVQSTERGHIVVDEYQNTSVPGLYALGDVCGREELTPGNDRRGRGRHFIVLIYSTLCFYLYIYMQNSGYCSRTKTCRSIIWWTSIQGIQTRLQQHPYSGILTPYGWYFGID